MIKPLIQLKHVKVSFYHKHEAIQVVRGVSIDVYPGEIVGILGESGSGKTVAATSILRLHEPGESTVDAGEIYFENRDLLQLSEREMLAIRGKRIAYIFQNPSAALNPYKTIGRQLQSLLKNHKIAATFEDILGALEEVGIDNPEQVYSMYPGQLSGGQNQRIMIAQAILCKPDLLIADEPTSAIDASLSRKVLNLLKSLNQKYGMSILIITHDFDVAKYLCHRLVIMYGGLVMESGGMSDIFAKPLHPYTEALMKCALSLDEEVIASERVVYALEGTPLTPKEFKDGCPFFNRCGVRQGICDTSMPEMSLVPDLESELEHAVRCVRFQEGVAG